MAELDHFESYEWLGFFWTPDKKLEFPGKLTYSPEKGIRLDFMCPAGQRIARHNHIHGALATGEICTLFGDFNPDTFGAHFGKISIYKANLTFFAAIFGAHTSLDEKFPSSYLDFTNFQEFCHPQGYKDFARYKKEPIHECKIDDLEISIVNNGKFKYLGLNTANLFHCDNEEVTKEIEQALSAIQEKHKDEEIFTRTDIGWELKINSTAEMTYTEINKNILLLERLLSLLIFHPVRRKKISILSKLDNQPGKVERLPVLTSLFDISGNKINILKREIFNLHQPITPRNLPDFPLIITNWMRSHEGFSSFAQRIENRFGKVHEHELRAGLVLALAQLEAIAHDLGNKKEKDKYDHPIKIYDKTQIEDALRTVLFTPTDSTVGKSLSDLRGEIAHVGRPMKLLKKNGHKRPIHSFPVH